MTPGIGGFRGLIPLAYVFSTDGCILVLRLQLFNDIVTSGAKLLSFQDQYSTGHLDVDVAEKVIKGIVDRCKESGCPLTGGETAEMADCYAKGKYDLSGSAVGIVKKDSLIDGKTIVVGDVLIGFPSSGVHSNGLSC